MRIFLSLAVAALLLAPASAFAESHAKVSSALDVSALRQGAGAHLAIVLDIDKGYHAQSHEPLDKFLIKLEIKPDAAAGIEFGEPMYPPGQLEEYPALGKLSVYTGHNVIIVPITVAKDATIGDTKLGGKVRMQICDDKTCFAPQEEAFSVAMKIVAPDAPVEPANGELFPAKQQQAGTQAAQVAPPASTEEGSVLGFFGLAFLAGLIFNVMPCVLPVLPLKAIGFYEVSQHDRKKTILLGGIFSLGVIAIFALLGAIVLLSKQVFHQQIAWGQQFSNPIFVWAVSLILIGLGIGMLGAFALRLPTSVYGLNFRHDTMGGNFMWGGLTAVLSTPCTAPLFPPVIAFAIAQPAVVGLALMVTVGAGMAIPYFLLSAFPGMARRFPRTGPVSELVKQMMAFLLFGTAAFVIGASINLDNAQALLICVVAVAASVFLVYRTRQITHSGRGLAVACAVALLISATAIWAAVPGREVDWVQYTPEAFAKARAEHRAVLVKFTAKWCANCVVLEKTVYRDADVINALRDRDVIPMKLDVDKAGWTLLNQLSPGAGIPFTAIYEPGKEQPKTLASMHDSKALIDLLPPAPPQSVTRS